MKQLALLMKTNDQATKQLRSAKTVQVTASVIGFAGGFMVGYPLGTALVGGEPNWVLASVGAGLIVVSFTLNHSAKNKTKQAVNTYNKGLNTSSFWNNSELKLSMTGNGIGLLLRL